MYITIIHNFIHFELCLTQANIKILAHDYMGMAKVLQLFLERIKAGVKKTHFKRGVKAETFNK